MNKKGFTLTELLAVIVLLGVILSVAIASVTSISSSVKKRQRENVIKALRVDAEKYHHDTGIPKVFVDTLIKEGYTDADKTVTINSKPIKVVLDPYPDNLNEANANFNCYYFDFEQENENNQFVKTDMDSNNECNIDIIPTATITMQYCASDTTACSSYSNVGTGTGWLNKEYVILSFKSNNSTALNVNNISDSDVKWISTSKPGVSQTGKTLQIRVPANESFIDTYQVIITAPKRSYRGTASIKVDRQSPVIEKIDINKENKWTKNKKVTIDVSDKDSGLSQYNVTLTNTVPSSGWKSFGQTLSTSNPKITSKIDTDSKNGVIEMEISDTSARYIWVKDKKGNISPASNNKVQATKTDTTKPECVVTGGKINTNWSTSPITVTFGCKDNESGCHTTAKTETYKNEKTKNYSYRIYDKAGNYRDCTGTLNLYVDTINPTCISSGGSTTWSNSDMKLYGKCTDNLSGCKNETIEKSYNSEINSSSESPGTVYDYAGNSATCPANQTVKIDKTKPNGRITISSRSGATDTEIKKAVVKTECYDEGTIQSGIEKQPDNTSLNANSSGKVTITCKDHAKNSRTITVTFSYSSNSACKDYAVCRNSDCEEDYYETCTDSDCCGSSCKINYNETIDTGGANDQWCPSKWPNYYIYNESGVCTPVYGGCECYYCSYSADTCTKKCCGVVYKACASSKCGYKKCWH